MHAEIVRGLANPKLSDDSILTLLRIGEIGTAIWLETDEETERSVAHTLHLGQFRAHAIGELGQVVRAINDIGPCASLISAARRSPHHVIRRIHATLAFVYEFHRTNRSPFFDAKLSGVMSADEAHSAIREFGNDPLWARECSAGLVATAHANRHDPKSCAASAVAIDHLGERFPDDLTVQERRATIWRINAYSRQADPVSCAKAVGFVEAVALAIGDRRVLRYERAHAWRCLAHAHAATSPAAARLAAESVSALTDGFRDDRALTMECIAAWLACARAECNLGQEVHGQVTERPALAPVPDDLRRRRSAIRALSLDALEQVHSMAKLYPDDVRAQAQRGVALHLQASSMMTLKAVPDAQIREVMLQASQIVARFPEDNELQWLAANIECSLTILGPGLDASLIHLEQTRSLVAYLQKRTAEELKSALTVLAQALRGASMYAMQDIELCRRLVDEVRTLAAVYPTHPPLAQNLCYATAYLEDAVSVASPSPANTGTSGIG